MDLRLKLQSQWCTVLLRSLGCIMVSINIVVCMLAALGLIFFYAICTFGGWKVFQIGSPIVFALPVLFVGFAAVEYVITPALIWVMTKIVDNV